ncbi:MAG TPA: hypothetical protein VG097_08180 [Gemmata sp.]|nr:hypothetical protein [Gemmata sp.]
MSDSTCDSSLYDPAFQVTVPVLDAREEFSRLSVELPQSNDLARVLAAHKTARRARRRFADRRISADADDGHSRAIGFWPIENQLLFTASTAIRYVIIFPDTVGGDFSTYLYLTSSNRSEHGTESHIAFVGQQGPEFWIYDWSLCNHRLARQIPISNLTKYIFPISTQGLQRNGILVFNQTRLAPGTTNWTNCVYLGVFVNGKLDHFDSVYSNGYELDSNAEQQPSCNGFWGPELETFQNYTQPINAAGFSGCWLIQDGVNNTLNDSNTQPHIDPLIGLKMFYQTPLRDFLVH